MTTATESFDDEMIRLIESMHPPSIFDFWSASLAARALLAWHERESQHAWRVLAELLPEGSNTRPEVNLDFIAGASHCVAVGLAMDVGDTESARDWMTGAR